MNHRLSSFIILGVMLAASAWVLPPKINANDPQHFLWNGVQWYPTGYTPGLNAISGQKNGFDKDRSWATPLTPKRFGTLFTLAPVGNRARWTGR